LDGEEPEVAVIVVLAVRILDQTDRQEVLDILGHLLLIHTQVVVEVVLVVVLAALVVLAVAEPEPLDLQLQVLQEPEVAVAEMVLALVLQVLADLA
jgi:hypothetical protein